MNHRRIITKIAALLCAAILIAGCSGSAEPPSSAGPEHPGNGFPVTIEHMLGTAVITKKPERVVALGLADQDIAIALGITPVAMAENPNSAEGRYPWTSGSELDDVVLLPLETSTASVEQIIALEPDLILATTASGDPALYDRYADSGVPIIAPPAGAVTASWQDLTRLIGRAVGRSDRAEEVIAETEAQVADTRAALPGLRGKTFAVAVASSTSAVRAVNKPTDTAAKFFANRPVAAQRHHLVWRTGRALSRASAVCHGGGWPGM